MTLFTGSLLLPFTASHSNCDWQANTAQLLYFLYLSATKNPNSVKLSQAPQSCFLPGKTNLPGLPAWAADPHFWRAKPRSKPSPNGSTGLHQEGFLLFCCTGKYFMPAWVCLFALEMEELGVFTQGGLMVWVDKHDKRAGRTFPGVFQLLLLPLEASLSKLPQKSECLGVSCWSRAAKLKQVTKNPLIQSFFTEFQNDLGWEGP